MTNKEKIFKLIDSCIENPEFFTLNCLDAYKVELDFSTRSQMLANFPFDPNKKGIFLSDTNHLLTSIREFKYIDYPKTVSYHDEIFSTQIVSKKEEYKVNESKKLAVIKRFKINFEDAPPITIMANSGYGYGDESNEEVLSEFSIFDARRKKFHLFGSKFIKTRSKLRCQIVQSTYKPRVFVTSGMLSVEITIDECNAFYDRIEQKYLELLKTGDGKKLDERIEQYCS